MRLLIQQKLYAGAYPRASGHRVLHTLWAVCVLVDQVKLARLYGSWVRSSKVWVITNVWNSLENTVQRALFLFSKSQLKFHHFCSERVGIPQKLQDIVELPWAVRKSPPTYNNHNTVYPQCYLIPGIPPLYLCRCWTSWLLKYIFQPTFGRKTNMLFKLTLNYKLT